MLLTGQKCMFINEFANLVSWSDFGYRYWQGEGCSFFFELDYTIG
jgi:hypothetical protein